MSIVLISPSDAKDIILLKHPQTSSPCQFLLTRDNIIHEVLALERPHKQSLFHGDNIISDATIYLASPFDPTFLLISQLSQAAQTEQFVESSELLEDFPACLQPLLKARLVYICDFVDVLGDGSEPYYRLSRTKVQNFIQARIASVQSALPNSILDKLPSAVEISTIAKQKAALELVASYLPPAVSAEIANLYDFSTLAEHMDRRKTEYVNPHEFIKRKNEADGDMNEPSIKKVKKGSKGVEMLKKVNTKGMRSMTSFFTKKAKT